MSTNLSPDSGSASSLNSAADASTASADNSAAIAAEPSAERSESSAASGTDASVDSLDRQYRENLLAADKPEADTAQPEKPQPEPAEKVEAKPDEVVEVEEPETDDLVEQTGPRTIEQLKKQFPRVSDKPLEEIARVEAEAFKLQQEVDAVGGTVGLEIAKAVMPALLSANPTDAEVDNVFQSVTETNPALMQRMSWQILTHSLKEQAKDASGVPINIATGNAIIKQFLNEKYDVDTLEKLIAYDEAGLIDREELDKELESFSGKSKRELELETRLKALETGKEQEKAAESTKTEARINQHVAKTEDYVTKGAMAQIVPIAEQYGWTATKEDLASTDPAVKELAEAKLALGELLTPWLDSFVRNHVKWAGVESLGKQEQAFNQDGNPTILLKKNGQEVINAAVAAFKQKVRVLNKTFAKSFNGNRASQLKAKTTRSGAVDPSEIPPVKQPVENGNRKVSDIDRLDEDYRRIVRENRASL